jgi:hypothetical protein
MSEMDSSFSEISNKMTLVNVARDMCAHIQIPAYLKSRTNDSHNNMVSCCRREYLISG